MSQRSLRQYAQGLISRPGSYSVVQRVRDTVEDIIGGVGVDLDNFGARPGELDDDTMVLRYQYSSVYEYYTRDSDGDTDRGAVQFRTTVYTLSDPDDDVKEYLKETNHNRLHALFETEAPYKGYMSGFGFISEDTNEEEAHPVGSDEVPATGLGVPNFAVEVYDEEGTIVGHSKGYSMDFGVHKRDVVTEDAPDRERWRVRSFNEPKGDYEVSPKPYSNARERSKKAAGKVAYINGVPVGSVTNRGTLWLTKEHTSPARATYRSRKWLVENTGTPYQALSTGSNLYKVRETPEGLYFSTVKPSGFDAPSPEDIDPDATELLGTQQVMGLVEDEPTMFVVTADVQEPWALGKRSQTQTVEVAAGHEFTIHRSW